MTTDSAKDSDPADRPSGTPAAAPVGQQGEPARRQDARSLQFALERQLEIDAGLAQAAEAPEKKPNLKPAENPSTMPRRLVKVALGLGLAVTLGWSPLRALLTTTSIEALINARVETIRSPIEGTVEAAPDADRDWTSGDAPPRLRVVDSLADHARLDDLKRQYYALETQSRGLQRKSELVSVELEALNVQIEGFRQGRLKLLDARVAAQTAELEALVAKSSQAARRRSSAPSTCGSPASRPP